MVWAVYPLVNLYDRGALPEFWGFIFLVSSLSCFLRFLKAPTHRSTRFDRYAWGFFYLLCGTTHPLTATMGGSILIISATIGLSGLGQKERWPFLRNCLMVTFSWMVAQSPWLWIMLKYGHQVVIIEDASNVFGIFAKILAKHEDAWTPLLPLTYTEPGILLSIYRGGRIATPLLLLLVGFIIINSKKDLNRQLSDRGFSVFGLILATTSYALITIPPVAVFLSPLVGFMQLCYRFNNFVNLGLLISLVGLCRSTQAADSLRTRPGTLLLAACLLLASISLVSKIDHVTSNTDSEGRWRNWTTADIHGLVPSFYGVRDYAIIQGFTPPDREFHANEVLPFVIPPNDPDSATADLTVNTVTTVPTRILPFPWNKIWVNGRQVIPPALGTCNLNERNLDQDKKYTWVNLTYYTVTLQPGHNHLEYRFSPPTGWVFLRHLSFFIAGIWAGLVIWLGVREAEQSK
jgi:hypothetical protein